MGFANKMVPGIPEGILCAEPEPKTFHHVRFSEKKGFGTSKSTVFGYFWKIAKLSTDVLDQRYCLKLKWAKLIARTLKVKGLCQRAHKEKKYFTEDLKY